MLVLSVPATFAEATGRPTGPCWQLKNQAHPKCDVMNSITLRNLITTFVKPT
jgi:hypothetical protein